MKSKVCYWSGMFLLFISNIGLGVCLRGSLTFGQVFLADAVIIVYGALMAASAYFEREELKGETQNRN